jgi:hypothetical protein
MQGSKAAVSYIGALVILDQEAARVAVRRAIERSRGRMVSAAIELGTCRRHLERVVHALDLWPEIDACRERWRTGQGHGLVAKLRAARLGEGQANV